MTLLVLSSKDSLEATIAFLKRVMYASLSWSAMPSTMLRRTKELSRPNRRSVKLVVLMVPLLLQSWWSLPSSSSVGHFGRLRYIDVCRDSRAARNMSEHVAN